MLISFKVSNFKSILEPVCLNMLADPEDPFLSQRLWKIKGRKEKANPFSVIMGANGSGKSSIIDALQFVKEICLRQKAKTIPRNKLAPRDMPSCFEVCFTGGYYHFPCIHKYSLTVFGDGKVQEEIYELKKNSWNKLITYNFETYDDCKILSTNELNIDWSHESFYKISRPDDDIYCFSIIFFKDLIFFNSIDNDNDIYSDEQMTKETKDKIESLGSDYKSLIKTKLWPNDLLYFKEDLIHSLNYFGVNVTDLKFELVGTEKRISSYGEDRTFVSSDKFNTTEGNEDKTGPDFYKSMEMMGLADLSPKDYVNVDIYYLSELVYGSYSVSVAEESSGTKRLLKLAFLLTNDLFLEHQVCVVIDEMDAGLHDTLSSEIMRQFLAPNSKGKPEGAQLIITSHNTVLLKSPDIRKDQIWFAEMKEENRTTDLYSLADLKGVKSTEDFAENYLRGAYGAIPKRVSFEEEKEDE